MVQCKLKEDSFLETWERGRGSSRRKPDTRDKKRAESPQILDLPTHVPVICELWSQHFYLLFSRGCDGVSLDPCFLRTRCFYLLTWLGLTEMTLLWVYDSLPSGPPAQVHSLGVEPSLHEEGAVSQATDGEE